MTVDQFLYFHGRAPGAPSAGFDIQCWSAGIDQADLAELRRLCFFRRIGDLNRACFARRLLADGRAAVTYKTELDYDNRYIVHGLMAPADELDAFEAASLAYGSFWIRDPEHLPAPGAQLEAVAEDDLVLDDQEVGFLPETRDLLGRFLVTGQVDLGADFSPSINILRALTVALLAEARARAEFVVGEQPKVFGVGPITAFGRALLPADCVIESTAGAPLGDVLTLLEREPALWSTATADPRVTYATLATLGTLHRGGQSAEETRRSIATLAVDQRIAALGAPSVADAFVAALSDPTGSAAWVDLLGEALVLEDPVRVDLGVRTSAARLATAVEQFDGRDDHAAALAALAWLALVDIDPAVALHPPPTGGWLARLLDGDRSGSRFATVSPSEAYPPFVLGLLLELRHPLRYWVDEAVASLGRYGVDAPGAERLLADPAVAGKLLDTLLAEASPRATAMALDVLVTASGPELFLDLLREHRLPPEVAREVLKRRRDVRREDLLAGRASTHDAVWPFVNDLGPLEELLRGALGVAQRSRSDRNEGEPRRRKWRSE